MRASNGYQKDKITMSPDVLRQFYTQRGWLTVYALSCGYIERVDCNGVSTQLWVEHGTVHVRQHSEVNGMVFWESTASLSEARKRFTQALNN